MATTESAPIGLFSYADGKVVGTYTVDENNPAVGPQVGERIHTIQITNTGPAGTLAWEIFARNSDGTVGAKLFGPGTIHVGDAGFGPMDVTAQNILMIGTTGPKGTDVQPPVIVMSSWSSA